MANVMSVNAEYGVLLFVVWTLTTIYVKNVRIQYEDATVRVR